MEKRIHVFDPTTTPKKQPLIYAPRPGTLEGKMVGLVDNTKFNSDKLLLKIGKILEKQFKVRGVLIRRKRSAGVPADEKILDELGRECDVVIAGIGDWGSCSSGSVLDGILFEKKGVPAASIITDAFIPTGRAMAESWGVPGYRFLVVPHPIANLTEEQLDQHANEIAPKVVELLLDKSLTT